MPIQAQSADGITHEFPDGTDQAVIGKVMKDYALQHTKTSAPGYKFSDDAINGAIKNSSKVVYMHPDQYLALTPDLESNPRTDKKGASLKKSLDNGDDVDAVPSLDVSVGKDGLAKVVDQDGRHRAQFAKDAGVDLIPVAVKRSGDKGLITHLAGMKDGTEPVPFDFKQVLPPQKAQTAPTVAPAKSAGAPRWDVLGDIGRAAEGAVKATGDDLKAAFPSQKTLKVQSDHNRKDYGLVGGAIKGETVDSLRQMGNALKAPLDALGVPASIITGTAHAIGGSAIAAGLDHMPIPGHDPKVDADQMIDQAMMGLGPEGMEGGAAGISAAAGKASAARTAAADAAKTGNALAKAQNLKPGAVEARKAGYVLPPVMATENPSLLAKFGSADAGKIKIQQAASVKNQEVTNRIAAQELGLPKDAVLTDKAFSDVRAKANKAYSDIANSLPYMQADDEYKKVVANLGGRSQEAAAQFKGVTDNPELDKLEENLGKVDLFKPDAGLFVVRKLRKDASANLKAIGDPNKAALGLAQRKAADAIDNLVERNLTAAGKTDLIPKYKAARQTLAKSHDIEGATNTTTGDVSAIGLARLSNRGRPFTGGLKTIADSANTFRKAFQNPEAFGGVEPYSVLDLGAAGMAAAWHRWDVLGGILARPAVRNALLSEGYQDSMIPDLSNIKPPQGGMALLHNTPLPGVQNQLAHGIFRAAHVNGLRSVNVNALRAAIASGGNPPTGSQGQ